MSAPRVILDNDSEAHAKGFRMEFYLTYEGPLNASQQERPGQPSRHVANKRNMRLEFHRQLRELWSVMPGLQDVTKGPHFFITQHGPAPATRKAELAAKHAHYGFNFVPLVTLDLDLLCSLDVLMLRPDRPGTTPWAGDIDNRLKTLLDALRVPEPAENYAASVPNADEAPFFVLLEDDKLLTKVSVETDRLLAPVNTPARNDDVRVFIKVSVRPYDLTVYNMHFG